MQPPVCCYPHSQRAGHNLTVRKGGHRAILRRGEDLPVPSPDAPQPVFLANVPLFHVSGNQSMLATMTASGGKICFMHKWSIGEAVRIIKSEKVTAVGGVPSMVREIS